jgi:glucose-1-phosphate adenylyltransferase
MKTRAVILAGGEGSRLGILTAKRTKPAVPFAGKYRIIDYTLSNCVNSGIFDVMILAQYRPHSLIGHIGAGGPWDLNRDFTGGVRIYTPYKARGASDWYTGTADAVQQNFRFIKKDDPDQVLILSGDHIYRMDYAEMIRYHKQNNADVTLATIRVPIEEASRFGIVDVADDFRVTAFIEKPAAPPSNLVNMGVYLFKLDVLNEALWADSQLAGSYHDFGKDILPNLIRQGARVFAYPFDSYWVDVGTVVTYWQAHMDLLCDPPSLDHNDRSWIIHTRTEERPPARIIKGAQVADSMISDGCVIQSGAVVERCILAPGVQVMSGAVVHESVILTEAIIEAGATVVRSIIDKRVRVGPNARVGQMDAVEPPMIAMVGKNSILPEGIVIEGGAIIGTDVIPSDFSKNVVRGDDYVQTQRLAYEV